MLSSEVPSISSHIVGLLTANMSCAGQGTTYLPDACYAAPLEFHCLPLLKRPGPRKRDPSGKCSSLGDTRLLFRSCSSPWEVGSVLPGPHVPSGLSPHVPWEGRGHSAEVLFSGLFFFKWPKENICSVESLHNCSCKLLLRSPAHFSSGFASWNCRAALGPRPLPLLLRGFMA